MKNNTNNNKKNYIYIYICVRKQVTLIAQHTHYTGDRYRKITGILLDTAPGNEHVVQIVWVAAVLDFLAR